MQVEREDGSCERHSPRIGHRVAHGWQIPQACADLLELSADKLIYTSIYFKSEHQALHSSGPPCTPAVSCHFISHMQPEIILPGRS